MIASKSQNEELVLYFSFLDVLEKLVERYTNAPTEDLAERIQLCNEVATFLKTRLEKHDYAVDDARATRVEKSMKQFKLQT